MAIALSICSNRAFAVTAIIGTCLTIVPSASNSRIVLAQVRPSMIGISRSIRMIARSSPEVSFPVQKREDFKASSASPPWFATSAIKPMFVSCF